MAVEAGDKVIDGVPVDSGLPVDGLIGLKEDGELGEPGRKVVVPSVPSSGSSSKEKLLIKPVIN